MWSLWAGVKRSPPITQAGTDRRPSPKQEQREVKASPQVDTPATKLKSKPSSSKPSSLPVVKQEQRKAHHPSIALLIPCSSFIDKGSRPSYISFCTPSLVALLYLPIKVNKGPSVSDGLDAPHWCQGPLWQCEECLHHPTYFLSSSTPQVELPQVALPGHRVSPSGDPPSP